MGKFAEPKLSDVAHAREGVLQFAQFTIEPALVPAVVAHMWLQQRFGIHLGTALFALNRAKFFAFDSDDFCASRCCRFHVQPPVKLTRLYSKAYATCFSCK